MARASHGSRSWPWRSSHALISRSSCSMSILASTRRMVFSEGATKQPVRGLRRPPILRNCGGERQRAQRAILVTLSHPARRTASTTISTSTKLWRLRNSGPGPGRLRGSIKRTSQDRGCP